MGLTPKQMNTELAQRLKDIFERSKKRRYAAFQAAEKLKKKDKSDDASEEHVDGAAMPRGVLAKDSQYAQRGSDYVRAQSGRGVYKNFDHPHLEHIRDAVRERAEFPGGPAANFTPSAKAPDGGKALQGHPYAWEAHHILPGSAFYYETAKGPCFTFRQLWILLQSDYNLNNGHNIIMLPTEDWAPPVHVLLQHPSDHPEYTQKVMADMKTIADELQKKIDQQQPHQDVAADFVQELEGLESKYWKYIVGLSRAVVYAVCAGQDFTEAPGAFESVRFATADGSTSYPYGALY